MDPQEKLKTKLGQLAACAEVRWRGASDSGALKAEPVALLTFDAKTSKFSVTPEGKLLLTKYSDKPCGFNIWRAPALFFPPSTAHVRMPLAGSPQEHSGRLSD